MSDDQIQQVKQTFPQVQENISFQDLTTVAIGGPARLFYCAQTQPELIKVVEFAKAHQIPFFILGGGSNLLVSDEGVNRLVIKVGSRGLSQVGNLVKVQAGTSLQELVDFTIKNGLAGVHKMTGIPGTVGGAIYGNAGAYGQMIGDTVLEVVAFDGKQLKTLTKPECQFDYRTSGFKSNGLVIIEATLSLRRGNPQLLAQESDQCLQLRIKKYRPGIKCPGSFFRNFYTNEIPVEALRMLPPREDTFGKTPAYAFLEALGAKGDQIGQVKITDFHANLFENLGGAKALDFWTIAKKWYQQVYQKFGVKLEPEVQLINLPPLS